jgi:hypothetical protein
MTRSKVPALRAGGAVTVKMRFLPFNPPAAEVVSQGLRNAAKEIGKSAKGKDFDSRRGCTSRPVDL